jgi:hypothetical protein
MSLRRFAILFFALFAVSTLSWAQKADVAFVAGATFSSDARVHEAGTCLTPCNLDVKFSSGTDFFFETTGAVRLATFKLASLHLELPIARIPASSVTFTNAFGTPQSSDELSAVFITPSLQFRLAPGSPVSPFVSLGGGWAHFGLPAKNNFGALQFGGGVNIKTRIQLLGIRAEVRDFMTAQPNFVGGASGTLLPPGSQGIPSRRHNVLVGGGIVLYF